MISKFSTMLLNRFIVNELDSKKEIEVYQYAMFLVISNIIFLFLSLFVGLICSCLAEMVIFFFTFKLLRHFAGGYHSLSEYRCEIISSISICLIGMIISLSKTSIFIQKLFIVTSILSFLIILFLSPIEAEAKPLTKEERRKYRKICIVIDFAIILIIIVSFFYNLKFVYTPCCLSLILETILLITGKYKEISANE